MSFLPLGFLAASGAAAGDYESIATVTVGSGGSSSISFSSIPSTYKHLQIRGIAKGTVASAALLTGFNGDTASNYNDHYIEGNGSSVVAGYDATSAIIAYGTIAPTAATSVFTATVIDILDYANTNKYKTTRALTGYDSNGSGYMDLNSGLWRSTAAISSITLSPTSGNFAQYTQYALYGIKE